MSTSLPRQEKKFFDALNDIFVWAKIEWKWGYINLMNIKNKYYKEHIYWEIIRFIEKRFNTNNSNREELFARLYTFFNRYFNETWSIYFQYTPLKENIYERVYSNKEDVSLFYKTHMLYYVKSERIFNSVDLKIEDNDLIQDFHFNFDVSNLELAKNNEKKEIVFSFEKVEKKKVFLKVSYSAKWNKTKIDDILKNIKKEDSSLQINEETLSKALTTYKKQSEVDYFINKDAKKFLKEQFNLWYYQYVFGDSNNGEFNVSDFDDRRIRELQATKEIAYKIIDFISQFEDELVKVWNKPKFVRKSNYVLTLDKLENNIDLIEKIINHKNFEKQEQEWKELWYKLDNYKKSEIIKKWNLNEEFKFLTIDTKYFEDIKYEILDLFDDLDNELDWVLINSDNYQALNTLQNKYRWKIKCIYIDPPFNLWENWDFIYKTNYLNSSWLTMLENRLIIAKQLLTDDGNIFLRCDYNWNYLVRWLMDKIFWKENYKNEIMVSKSPKITEKLKKYHNAHDTLFFYSKNKDNSFFHACTKKRNNIKWQPMHLPWIRFSPMKGEYFKYFSKENIKNEWKTFKTNARFILWKEYLPPKWRHWALSQEAIFEREKEWVIRINDKWNPEILQSPEQLLTDNWTDISWYSKSTWFATENAEILLKRVIETSTNVWDIVLDFFMWSATTQATAHKLWRKFIWFEVWEQFINYDIPRLKEIFYWVQKLISKDVKHSWWWFLKYQTLEQYEEALEKVKYKEETIFIEEENKDIFSNYIFLKDKKLTESIELDLENGKTKIDLSKIYDDIDIAETLSNIAWRKIKKIKKDSVILEWMDEIKFDNIPLELIKPLIWWK